MDKLIKKQHIRSFVVVMFSVMMLACAHVPDQHTAIPDVWKLGNDALAEKMHASPEKINEDLLNEWISPLVNTQTVALVTQLYDSSPALKKASFQMKLAESNYLLQTRQNQPELDLGVSKQRSLSSESYASAYKLSLNLNWQADIWRSLKAQTRAAQLRLMQDGLNFQQTQNTQISELLKYWLGGIEAQQVLAVVRDRKQSVKVQSEVVTDNYVAGQGSPRDVLQSRESTASIDQQVVIQETALQNQMRKVLLALGDSLSSHVGFPSAWPNINKFKLQDISVKYILNREDVKQAWLELAALDSEVAAAHRNRFPALNFSLSSGFSSSSLENLFDSSSLFWTLFGGVTQPLFDQRRLKTQYAQSILRSQQQEQVYLETVQKAISEINTIRDQLLSLEKQQVFVARRVKASQDNEDMVIEQYLMGIAIYDSVLTAQQQLLDAKTDSIQLHSQYLETCINLFIALGGSFNELPGFSHVSNPLEPRSDIKSNASTLDLSS